jgi:hypothetical protein
MENHCFYKNMHNLSVSALYHGLIGMKFTWVSLVSFYIVFWAFVEQVVPVWTRKDVSSDE